MLVCLPALLLAPELPELAFVARFYKPGAAKSYTCVYTSDLDGQHLRKLATTDENAAVGWVDDHTVGWISAAKGGKTAVHTMDLASGVAKSAVVAGNWVRTYAWRYGPGQMVLKNEAAETMAKVLPNAQLTRELPVTPVVATAKLSSQGMNLVVDPAVAGDQWRFETAKGTVDVASNDTPEEMYSYPTGSLDFVLDRAHDSTLGTYYWLRKVDWATPDLQPICSEFSDCDFWPGRDTVAFLPVRDLVPTKWGTELWQRPLMVGNWKTQLFHAVFVKDVDVKSVSLRR